MDPCNHVSVEFESVFLERQYYWKGIRNTHWEVS